MTTSASRLGAALYEKETNFGEDVSTFGTRLQLLNRVDLSGLTHERVNINPTQQRPHEGVQDIRLGMGGSFTIELLLTGHGGTAAGALTQTDLATLLGYVVGNVHSADSGGTADGTGSASAIDITGGSFTAGGLLRLGQLGDGRGEGQFLAVKSFSSGTATLLTDAPSAASAGDVVYASQVVYPSETPGSFESVDTLRFRLLTANKQFDCHGCYPTSIEFLNLNADEIPRVRITFGVAWFRKANVGFPDTTATDAKTGAKIAAGSLFLNDVGTSTRQTYGLRDFSITIENEVVPLRGPGGNNEHQVIVGCKRVRCQAKVSTTFDAESTGTQTWYDLYQTDEGSVSSKHMLWTGSVGDGKAVAFYFPNLKITSPVPTQQEADGLNRVTVEWEAMTSTDTTSDETLSNWRLAMG